MNDTHSTLVSLVIATLEDDGDLAHCLQSLCEQRDAPRFEVIIVDQNESNDLAETLTDFAGRLDIIYKHTNIRGASRARNLGASLARGIWLGFPDDDCRLLPDALHEVRATTRDPAVHVITGRTIDSNGSPNVLRWKDRASYFDKWTMFGCLTEATLFVRRDTFLLAGGFDERFGPGAAFPAAEGVELMNRLFGHVRPDQVFYNPAVQMEHPTKVPPWNRAAVSRFHSCAIGDGALIGKSTKAHTLNWGFRTLVRSLIEMVSFNRWKSAAYAARIAGLFQGFIAYRF